ncbi:flavoprotein [Tsukamurella sp. 1534]|uniref:flavoprotein n=1 Tax=Tsukamurella sp. 1534 TaxID=1151061 RepID=UPI0002EEFEE6|nr:flavoprotein [Tsukamurella sp. 1534]
MRLVLFGTGALNACHLPLGVSWHRANRPADSLRIVLSPQATRFVSPLALSALSGRAVAIDDWDDPGFAHDGTAPHTAVLADADAVLIYPATLNTLGRLARLDAATPMLNALHCTDALIAVSPNLPPGAERNPAVQQALSSLGERPNVLLIDGVVRPGVSTGADSVVSPPFWEVLPLIESRIATGGVRPERDPVAPEHPESGYGMKVSQ